MAGIYKLEIKKSIEELKQLLRDEKNGNRKEKLQILYLLKTQKALTGQKASELIGRNRVTVQDWLKKYRQGGRREFLSSKNQSRKTAPNS